MKTRHLPILLLTFVLILYATPTVHAAEPPDPPNHAGTVKLPPFELGDGSIETWDGPVGVLGDSSVLSGTISGTTWQIETVDSEGDVGYYTSLALDEAGHPHVSYHDGYPNNDLKYAWHDGTGWHVETVDSEGNVGGFTSLALDQAGYPCISYYDGSNNDLKYAQYDGADWHIETVDSGGTFNSLALDDADHPCISYSSGTPNYDLKHAWHDGINWHVETVDSGEVVSAYISLALDGAAHPHISYLDYANFDLKYAWHNGTNWQIDTVDSEKDEGAYSSLVLDEAGHPRISYHDWENGELRYAWHNGTNWQIETVDSEGFVGAYTSLALDEAGHPHVGYYGGSNGDLKYAWHDGANWQIETVDSEGYVGWYTSLALDAAGLPHISYYDFVNGDLKYARLLPFSLNKQVTPSDSLNDIDALTHTLTYSLTLFGPGWDFVLQDPLPDAVHYVSDSITSTLTPPAVYSPTLNAVVWEGRLPTDTIQTIHFQVTPQITSTRFLSAPLPIVNTAWLTATEGGWGIAATAAISVTPPPLALDKQVSFDGQRLYNGDLLTYTLTLTGPGLNVRLWDLLPDTVRYVSSSLTSTLPSPAIYSPTARAIVWEGTLPTDTTQTARFQVTTDIDDIIVEAPSQVPLTNTAWLTAAESGREVSATVSVDVTIPPSTGNWQIETVDSEGDVGWDTSLVLDEAGHPHISYHDSTNGDLKYAWHNGASWHIETVDSEGNVGQYTSLALDEAGHPHISYHDSTNRDLKYAWHDGIDWQIEIVDSEGDVGWYTSLVLDEAGHPHISYHDSTNGDLKYVWHNGTNWQIEIVDSEWYVGYGTSLALDEAGHPHISYHNFLYDYDLKYAWHNGTDWQMEIVDSEGVVYGRTSLALDDVGHPHISYHTTIFQCDLKYAWHNGTNWQIEIVDSEGYVGWAPSLALDGLNRPHISYCDSTNGDLKYTWHDGVNWQIETVDSEGMVDWYTSLALDAARLPHISYYDFANGDLKYARLLPFALDKQVVPSDSLNDVNALTHTLTYSLTLFGPGLNVRLRDSLPDTVHYVPASITSTLTPPAVYSPTLNAVVWQGTLPTDTARTIHFQVTPEITSTRFLSAPLYINNAAWMDDLEHERRVLDTAAVTIAPPPLTLKKQAAPNDGLRNNDTLTYTLTLYGPGLNVRLWDPLPPLVHYVPGSITDTIGIVSGTLALPAAVYSPAAHAVVWQGTLPTDTVEVIRFQVTPGLTGTLAFSLSLSIVNTAWLTNTDSGRSISATVIVNGYRRYLPVAMIDD